MPARKLTRKGLKQDSFVDWTSRVVEVLQEHFLKFAVGLLVVVVVLVGFSLYRQGQTRAGDSAAYLLYQGESLLARGAFIPAQERLRECIDRFGGTFFARRARLDLGHAQMAAGENEAALATFEEALRKVPAGDPLRRDLKRFQAAALTNLGRRGEAAGLYRDLLGSSLTDQERLENGLRLADCLKGEGQVGQAIEVLEGLQAAVERGEITSPVRDLEARLQLFRALPH